MCYLLMCDFYMCNSWFAKKLFEIRHIIMIGEKFIINLDKRSAYAKNG